MRALRVVGDVAGDVVAKLESATRLDTLEEILHWGGHVLEVVVQDEYTHDVIVEARMREAPIREVPGREAPDRVGHAAGFLVFDTT